MLSTVWTHDKQFMPHNLTAKAELSRGKLALNAFGRPEGFFVFGRAPMDYVIAVDLDVTTAKDVSGNACEVVVGLNMLCPRCGSSCYVHGPKHTDGREIIIHWDRMKTSEIDLKLRPPITIVGPVACDYSWGEVNGIVSPRNVSRCAWRGVIENGRAHDSAVRLT